MSNPNQQTKPKKMSSTKGRNPRVSKGAKETETVRPIEEQPKCHIHDEVDSLNADIIRKNVCVNDEPLKVFEGKHYCLFHLPTNNKDADKFQLIIDKRFAEIAQTVANIEGEHLETDWSKEKSKLYYDFRFVWFPPQFKFDHKTFAGDADFSSANFDWGASFQFSTFTASANFSSATFMGSASFSSANFTGDAYFNRTTFRSHTYFSSATFTGDAEFISATFTGDTEFISAIFSAKASFNRAIFLADANFFSATFSADALFERTKFSKNGTANFKRANFAKDTYFDRTRFRNEVTFNSAIFGNESYVIFRRAFFARKADFQYCTAEGYLIFTNPRQGRTSSFEFQHTAFEKASRISFHTIDLCPSWLINVDARKFVFTDIFWRNLDWDFWNTNIKRELESLNERGIKSQKKRIFEITARQLAVNAEENNRYDEASKFRYMAMETKRLDNVGWRSFINLHLFYKWSSGYGESWRRASVVLLGLLILFGVLYASPLVKFDFGETFHSMNLGDGLIHSLFVSALQRPEPKPADTLTKFFVILETIFAPLQAALLALAIRRKFMR